MILSKAFSVLPVNFQFFLSELNHVQHTVQIQKDWLEAYIRNYIGKGQIRIISFYKEAELVGVLPLQVQYEKVSSFVTLRKWVPLASGPSDFYPILFQEKWCHEIANSLVEYLALSRKDWDELILDNVPKSDPNFAILEMALAKLGIVKTLKSNGFVWVNTEQSWEDYYNQFLKPRNKDLWKDLRKLERNNINLHVELVTKNIFLALQNVLDLYASRRESLGQENKYQDEARNQFVKEVINAREKKREVELSLLKDEEGNTWAFQLDWLQNGIRYHWNHAYNLEFKKYSPGKLLLYKLMQASFADHTIKSCNHMRGLAGYKTYLANKQEGLLCLKVTNKKSIPLKKLSVLKQVASFKNKFF